mmetsp:Transcript_27822/g.70291  ORF Transcript_27822/g.70291 Transcript_27822/m.70291 type:complete len:439 (+) Transcript_27822:82-1398(+)|eukprot:g9433.t1
MVTVFSRPERTERAREFLFVEVAPHTFLVPSSDATCSSSSSSSSKPPYGAGDLIACAQQQYQRFLVDLGWGAETDGCGRKDEKGDGLSTERKTSSVSVLTKRPIVEEIEKLPLPLFVAPALLSSAYLLYGKWLFGAAASGKMAAPGASLFMGPGASPQTQQAGEDATQPSVAATLFPDFKGDTFLKRICVLQIMEYVGSLFLTMGSIAATPAARLMGTKFALSPNTCSLYLLGASWGPSIASGEVWRLITPMMLHANGLHIFFNLFFQSRVGFGIEEQLGTRKFMILYLFCGFFGNLVSILVDPYKLAVGASTSAFGLLGVWFSEVHLTWHLLSEESKGRLSFWFGGMLLALIVMSNLAPHIDMWGHVGGLLGGYLMSMCLADMSEEHRPSWYDAGKKICKMTLAWTCLLGTGKVVFMNPTIPVPNCGTLLHPKNILM